MKIQIFDVIKQGIGLSFRDKTVLSLIALYSISGIVFAIAMEPFAIEQEGLNEVAYPSVLPDIGINEGLFFFASIIISIIIYYAIAKATFENLNKREGSVSDAIVSVLKKIIPIFIAGIIYFIVVIIGIIALIIPGIFLAIAFFFYSHSILLNNKGIFTSFEESYNIVKGNWWQVFTLYLILIIISVLIGLLFGSPGFFFPTPSVLMVVSYFVAGIAMVVYTIIYFQLTKRGEKIEEGVVNIETIQEKQVKTRTRKR